MALTREQAETLGWTFGTHIRETLVPTTWTEHWATRRAGETIIEQLQLDEERLLEAVEAWELKNAPAEVAPLKPTTEPAPADVTAEPTAEPTSTTGAEGGAA